MWVMEIVITTTRYIKPHMATRNSRLVAIKTLDALEKKEHPLPLLFDDICQQANLPIRDRSLAMTLVYGVLRRRDELEALISTLCKMPLKKLHPMVRHGLCVGLFQLFFLDRIPDSAAVNETVKATKSVKIPKRLHGFVNGVLREAARQRDKIVPGVTVQPETKLLNHPPWLTRRWQSHFGERTMRLICSSNNNQPPLTLRINTAQISREEYLLQLTEAGIEASCTSYSPVGIFLPGYQGTVSSLPLYHNNTFHVQGEAAQLATLLLAPWQKDGRYLDGCAGLGGKTAHLLDLTAAYGAHITAVEPEPSRLEKLQSLKLDCERNEDLTIIAGDLQDFSATTAPLWDGVLVDAPCSGTGVIGRQPDIRWKRQISDIQRYATLQKKLLHSAGACLKPGGVLVYATCSLEPEENHEVVQHFLEQNKDFILTPPLHHLPEAASPLIRENCFHPLPSDGMDGFFAARLVCKLADD